MHQELPAGVPCPPSLRSPGFLLLPMAFGHTRSLAQAPASVQGRPGSAPEEAGPLGPQNWPECWAPPFLGSVASLKGLGLSFPPGTWRKAWLWAAQCVRLLWALPPA